MALINMNAAIDHVKAQLIESTMISKVVEHRMYTFGFIQETQTRFSPSFSSNRDFYNQTFQRIEPKGFKI